MSRAECKICESVNIEILLILYSLKLPVIKKAKENLVQGVSIFKKYNFENKKEEIYMGKNCAGREEQEESLST